MNTKRMNSGRFFTSTFISLILLAKYQGALGKPGVIICHKYTAIVKTIIKKSLTKSVLTHL